MDVAGKVRALGYEGAVALAPDLPPFEAELLWEMVAFVVEWERRRERREGDEALRRMLGG